jgi:glycosyltransferase involved in cell wall biosynthesis
MSAETFRDRNIRSLLETVRNFWHILHSPARAARVTQRQALGTRRMALGMIGRVPPPDPSDSTVPRGHVFEDLFVRRYNESVLDSMPPSGLLRAVPAWARLAAEIRRRADEYDVIVTWSERLSLSLLTMDRVRGCARPHVAMMYWFSRPSVRVPLLALADRLHALITWSSVQRKYAIEHLRIPPEKIYLVNHYVDDLFWQPSETETDMICSAGSEMRDYPTLLEALRGTDIRCHIASDHVRVDRFGFARREGAAAFAGKATANVTIGRKTPSELRALYARSRFVVVPLEASDTDNGITVILEAMAMGKPVICSRTRGQVDVIREGVTGLFVPVGDPVALREAILSLWHDPARASAMGRAAREYAEQHHALEKFCGDVKDAIDASLDGDVATASGAVSSRRPAVG